MNLWKLVLAMDVKTLVKKDNLNRPLKALQQHLLVQTPYLNAVKGSTKEDVFNIHQIFFLVQLGFLEMSSKNCVLCILFQGKE